MSEVCSAMPEGYTLPPVLALLDHEHQDAVTRDHLDRLRVADLHDAARVDIH